MADGQFPPTSSRQVCVSPQLALVPIVRRCQPTGRRLSLLALAKSSRRSEKSNRSIMAWRPFGDTMLPKSVYEVGLGWASLFCTGSRNGSPGPYSKLILSCSTTSGRFCTRVWIVPMYSPMMPINSIWIDMKKNTPIRIGAMPREK